MATVNSNLSNSAIWANTQNGYVGISPSYQTISNTLWDDIINKTTFKEVILTYLNEDELRNILNIIKGRSRSEDEIQDAVKEILRSRHCSEEFILEFLDTKKLDKEALYAILEPMHKVDIKSGAYAQLALLLELAEN